MIRKPRGKIKTASIIIIGDEILSGRVKDTNSYYLAKELRALGVQVKCILIISDDVKVIAKTVTSTSKTYDYVFTSGGVGPTHDDLTLEGIAKGFGLKSIKNKTMMRIIRAKCGIRRPDEEAMKMAYIPKGAQLILREGMRFPVVVFKNIFIFPGIPSLLRQKFSLIKDRFSSGRFYLKKLYVNEEECFISTYLRKIADEFPDVAVGSYPVMGMPQYKVKVTLESTNKKSLLRAYNSLLGLFPPEIVVRPR